MFGFSSTLLQAASGEANASVANDLHKGLFIGRIVLALLFTPQCGDSSAPV